MASVKVRTVFKPHEETEMPEDEAKMLGDQGLLVKDKPAPGADRPAAETKVAPNGAAGKDA